MNENDAVHFDREWSMGSCHGPKLGRKYSSNESWYDRCCLPEGQYTLTCSNTKSKYGWGNVAFEINGKRYCDDFVGFKAMRTISIKGRNLYFQCIKLKVSMTITPCKIIKIEAYKFSFVL